MRSGHTSHELITLWGLFVETNADLHRRFEADYLAALGVGRREFEILVRLSRSSPDGVRPARLAEQASFTTGGLSKLLRRLDELGLVEHDVDPHDARARVVRLRDDARSRIDAVLAAHADAVQEVIVDELGTEDARVLEALLRRLRDAQR